ncbi:hypothetical protein ACNKCP_002253 [Cronobacter dublinensis]
MNFDVFDESIGVIGYFNYIKKIMFPNSTEFSFDIAEFRASENTYPKGSYFSRVRWISQEKANEFINGHVDINDFYPPRPHLNDIPEGRFNSMNSATMYLSDHPFIAMKECDIKEGDFFLLSYFSLPKNMCFLYLNGKGDKLSVMLYSLLKTKDKRFYPVINLVYSELLKFNKHDGIEYDSTKIDANYIDKNGWGPISTVKNYAIQNERIKSFKLEVSWLATCGKNNKPIEHAMFLPLSNKKRNQISILRYSDNKKIYGYKTTELKEKMQDNYRKGKRLLDKGMVKTSKETPFKIIGK